MTEALKYAQDAVLARLKPAKVAAPGQGPLDFPAPPIAPQLAAVRARNGVYPYGSQRRLGQSYFVRRSRGDTNSQRYTLAIGQYHGFRALAALRFTDCAAAASRSPDGILRRQVAPSGTGSQHP